MSRPAGSDNGWESHPMVNLTSPYHGQRVRRIGTSAIARVSRYSGNGATMRVWIRYRPDGPEICHWACELEPFRAGRTTP